MSIGLRSIDDTQTKKFLPFLIIDELFWMFFTPIMLLGEQKRAKHLFKVLSSFLYFSIYITID